MLPNQGKHLRHCGVPEAARREGLEPDPTVDEAPGIAQGEDGFLLIPAALELKVAALVFQHRLGRGKPHGGEVRREHRAFGRSARVPGLDHGTELNRQPGGRVARDAERPADGPRIETPEVRDPGRRPDQRAGAGGMERVVDVHHVGGVEHLAGHLDAEQTCGEGFGARGAALLRCGEHRREGGSRGMHPHAAAVAGARSVGDRLPRVVEVVHVHRGAVRQRREPRRKAKIGADDDRRPARAAEVRYVALHDPAARRDGARHRGREAVQDGFLAEGDDLRRQVRVPGRGGKLGHHGGERRQFRSCFLLLHGGAPVASPPVPTAATGRPPARR